MRGFSGNEISILMVFFFFQNFFPSRWVEIFLRNGMILVEIFNFAPFTFNKGSEILTNFVGRIIRIIRLFVSLIIIVLNLLMN